MNVSANRIAKLHNDPVVSQSFFPTATDRAAFRLEHQIMMQNGGPLRWFPSSPTYNIIYSPGRNY
jgi:hypothetical protein